jgi:perosamine synthetase
MLTFNLPAYPQVGLFAPTMGGLDLPSVVSSPHRLWTINGRSALYWALVAAKISRESTVLVPTYHCPTMISPIVAFGAQVAYFGIDDQTRINMADISQLIEQRAQSDRPVSAILAPHFFGWPQANMLRIKALCEQHRITLIEDCAHQAIGKIQSDDMNAMPATVGSVGDYAIASLAKFFPTGEGGLLSSYHHPIDIKLKSLPFSARWQMRKQRWQNSAISGHNNLLSRLIRMSLSLRGKPIAKRYSASDPVPNMAALQAQFSMQRAKYKPGNDVIALAEQSSAGRVAGLRQARVRQWLLAVEDFPGCRPIFNKVPASCAPYVFPIWVANPQPVFERLRLAGIPVFRWDWLWPDTPKLAHDVALNWGSHVLQLPCHQSISDQQFDYMTKTFKQAVSLSLETVIHK